MSVLDDILARKRIDVAARQSELPLSDFKHVLEPTQRSLAAALRQPGLRFIFECKRASPSEGLLRETLDPAAIADDYRDVADAISVLTDTPYFSGSFTDLEAVRARVPQPILCKDFVIGPYQVAEARRHGADAVLLMLSVLDDTIYRECAAMAQRLGMECLTEVHDEAELERALQLDARIIGINNRDLKTLKIDLGTTARLAPRIPRDRVIVCESGIRTRADIDAVAAHVDAFLVGSQLMKAPRIDLAARRLMYGQVKVCGLTSPDDIDAAYRTGASLGGLIFATESPRCVDASTAHHLAEQSRLPLVGVFVNDDPARIAQLVSALSLHAVQLHGDETPEYVSELRVRLPDHCAIWKAVRLRDDSLIPLPEATGADFLLLDTYSDHARGGSGQSFDWTRLKDYPAKDRVILAGGIDPENVRDAHAIGCHGLDVNSGVESAPGIKDKNKLRNLFAGLRGITS